MRRDLFGNVCEIFILLIKHQAIEFQIKAANFVLHKTIIPFMVAIVQSFIWDACINTAAGVDCIADLAELRLKDRDGAHYNLTLESTLWIKLFRVSQTAAVSWEECKFVSRVVSVMN